MRVFFLSLLICMAATPLFAQGTRPATEAEKAFTQKLEQRMTRILSTAAKSMPGQWTIHFNEGKINEVVVNTAQHTGRPHEFRLSLSMEYSPTSQEKAAMEKELIQFHRGMSKKDIIAGNRQNDPTLRYAIDVTAIINPYNFSPVDVQQVASLGGTTEVMGTALTTFRTKDLGPSAPFYSLYIGDYKTTNTSGKKLLEENFVSTPDCCNARTMIIEVHSSQAIANNFVSKLDIPGLNRIIEEL